MPVQDTEKKTETSAPVQDEAEKLRQQKQAERPKKLLPFLNAKAQHHQSRIDSLDGKIAAETDKVDRLRGKIGGLKAQAQELSDRNRFLKETFGEFPLVQSMIEKNEKRIQKILDVKIPKCSQKIDMSIDKINAFSAKSQVIQHKLDRVVALSDTVKSFRIRMNTERRAVFSDAMDRLSQASVDCLSDKKAELTAQRQELFTKYDAPETSVVDKLEIQRKIDYLAEQISNIDEKIAKYNLPDNRFADKNEENLDAAIVLTSEKLTDMASRGQFTVTGMAEQSLDAAQSTMTMEPEILAETAKRAIAGVEEMTEDKPDVCYGQIR